MLSDMITYLACWMDPTLIILLGNGWALAVADEVVILDLNISFPKASNYLMQNEPKIFHPWTFFIFTFIYSLALSLDILILLIIIGFNQILSIFKSSKKDFTFPTVALNTWITKIHCNLRGSWWNSNRFQRRARERKRENGHIFQNSS